MPPEQFLLAQRTASGDKGHQANKHTNREALRMESTRFFQRTDF